MKCVKSSSLHVDLRKVKMHALQYYSSLVPRPSEGEEKRPGNEANSIDDCPQKLDNQPAKHNIRTDNFSYHYSYNPVSALADVARWENKERGQSKEPAQRPCGQREAIFSQERVHTEGGYNVEPG